MLMSSLELIHQWQPARAMSGELDSLHRPAKGVPAEHWVPSSSLALELVGGGRRRWSSLLGDIELKLGLGLYAEYVGQSSEWTLHCR